MSQNSANVPEPNVDLGMIIGLLLTDGWIRKNKTSWEIGFTNKSEELHTLFEEKMKMIFPNVHFTRRLKNNKEVKDTTINSKQIGNLLHNFLPSFRKKVFDNGTFPNSKIPDFFFQLSKEELKEILKTMFSADGCIMLSMGWRKKSIKWRKEEGWEIKTEVTLGCKHPVIKEQILELLKNLGFAPRKDNDKVILGKEKDIIKFKNEIGFVRGVKISRKSKNWEGFEKNQILNLAIKSFELKKKDLQQFKTKEEVVDFLKTLVPAQAS